MATPSGLGIQVQEERGPDETIARLGCARTAFVGRTLRGPVNRAVALHSFAQFQHTFGGLWQPSPLGYAVEQFFDNGGREAFVVRVTNGARAATLSLRAGSETMTLRAVRPGTREFLRASVDYDNLPAVNTAEFNLTVQRVRVQGTAQVEDQEIFSRVSLMPDAERYVGHLLSGSELIEMAGAVPRERPNQTLDAASGIATGYVPSNADGDDGAPLTDYDLIGSQTDATGVFALGSVDYFNFLYIPPLSRERDVGLGVLMVAARYCRHRRAMLVVDPPSDWHTADEALRGMSGWPFADDHALMYFPRILAHDKLRGHFESFASGGAVAGMLAKTDETYPVWGASRNEESILRPGYRSSCLVAEDKRMRLAALGVNSIQSVRSAARIGVAPRTLAGGTAGSPDWQNLAARRLALFILNSIERGTRWVAFAHPRRDAAELAAIQVRAFFLGLHEDGAFGARPLEESFFVICDRRINPEEPGAAAAFHLLIGFAAARRREFHSYLISHSWTGSKIKPVTLNRLNIGEYSLAEIEWVDRLASQLLAT